MSIRSTLFLLLVAMAAVDAFARDAVLEVKISASEPESDVISFESGRQSGISVGDLFWIVDEATVCRFGTIYFTTESACVGRFLHRTDGPPCSASAHVLRQNSLAGLRKQFPLAATIRGKISRIEKETAWVDVGRSGGLRLKDTILIRRLGIPLARGQVELLESGAAMVAFEKLVTNASPQADDSAELWPAPGDASFRVNSTVLDVTSAKEGDVITIVGNAADGYEAGRQVDVFHGDEFVGVASILKTEDLPISRAKMTKAETRANPDEGDWAYVRPGAGPPVPPLSAVIFRVEQDYCLIAAGEVDGVQRGEKLLVYPGGAQPKPRKAAAEITIDKVNVDYSGGSIRILDAAAPPLQVWSFAERIQPRRPLWHHIGEIRSLEPKWRLCSGALDQDAAAQSGDIVGLAGQGSPEGVGLLVARFQTRALVYIPPGWGDLERLTGARVMLREVESTATQAAGSMPSDE